MKANLFAPPDVPPERAITYETAALGEAWEYMRRQETYEEEVNACYAKNAKSIRPALLKKDAALAAEAVRHSKRLSDISDAFLKSTKKQCDEMNTELSALSVKYKSVVEYLDQEDLP